MTMLLMMAKARAKRLRQFLNSIGLPIGHSQCLEAIAAEDGHRDWNTYSAKLKAPIEGGPFPPVRVGESVRGMFRGAAFKGMVLGLEKTDGGPPQLEPVWRLKIHFNDPVQLDAPEGLNLTRRRVRVMINGQGQSVNLKGRLDGHLELFLS